MRCDVVEPWCSLLEGRGLTGDTLLGSRWFDGWSSFSVPMECAWACTSHLVWAFNASPTSRPSRLVRARGGSGGCAVHGQEMRMVKVGIVRLGGRVVEGGWLGHERLGYSE
jgi:hypothetical protein